MTLPGITETPTVDVDLSTSTVGQGTVGGLGEGAARPTVPAHGLRFTVRGLPAPQGSKRGYVVNGRAVLVESSKRVRPWREAVKHAALELLDLEAIERRGPLFTGPLMVTVVYTLPRPKSHYRAGRNAHLLRDAAPKWPTGVPDVGKITRATEDALTDAGMWRDDAQIVVSVSVKTYPDVHPRALKTPGAYIRITPLPPETTESG